MARIAITIRTLHPDERVRDHKVKPSGKPADPTSGCPGRRSYDVHCSTHERAGGAYSVRSVAEEYQKVHRSQHLTAKAAARA